MIFASHFKTWLNLHDSAHFLLLLDKWKFIPLGYVPIFGKLDRSGKKKKKTEKEEKKVE